MFPSSTLSDKKEAVNCTTHREDKKGEEEEVEGVRVPPPLTAAFEWSGQPLVLPRQSPKVIVENKNGKDQDGAVAEDERGAKPTEENAKSGDGDGDREEDKEVDKKDDKDDDDDNVNRVGMIHPIFVLPWGIAERTRLFFDKKTSF